MVQAVEPGGRVAGPLHGQGLERAAGQHQLLHRLGLDLIGQHDLAGVDLFRSLAQPLLLLIEGADRVLVDRPVDDAFDQHVAQHLLTRSQQPAPGGGIAVELQPQGFEKAQIEDAAGLPVVAYRNSTERTIPATAKLFDAIMSGALVHDGSPSMARHLDNCILKIDNRGARITKDFRQPKLKVDNAIALMMAYDRASGRMEEQVVPQFFV